METKEFEIHWFIKGLTKVKAKNEEDARTHFNLMDIEELLDCADPIEIEDVSKLEDD